MFEQLVAYADWQFMEASLVVKFFLLISLAFYFKIP